MSPLSPYNAYSAIMLPSPDCTISEDVCCPTIYDIGQHILAGVYEALLGCVQPTPCNAGGWIAYVTMGEGDDLVLDALSVAIQEITLSDQSQPVMRISPIQQARVTYRVRIIESGWPMAYEDNGEIFQPDPVLQNALARHAYSHGERMYRKVVAMAARGELLPDGYACSASRVGSLIPLNPAGGTVGFFVDVSITLPWGA